MKLFQSLWVLIDVPKDNEAMDVTQIEPTPADIPEPTLTQQDMQEIAAAFDYSDKKIINLLDYKKTRLLSLAN